MRRLASCAVLVCLVAWSLALLRAQNPPKAVTVEGDHFNVDGTPTFLIFVSYFDALRASPTTWATDLGYLSSHGIHGVRIFTSWSNYCGGSPPPTANDGVIRTGGTVDATMLNTLKDFLATARSYGMVVDVTFDRDTVTGGMTLGQYQNAIQYVVGQISSYENAIVDVQNEYDNYPTHNFSNGDIAGLIGAVHTGDADRRAAGSLGASPSGAASAGSIAVTYGHDFSAVHDTRTATWYQSSDISTLISNLKSGLGVLKPIYFQEPTPWASNPCGGSGSGDTTPSHFTTAIAAAKASGAAAWTFHTRLGFELTSASLLSRLNSDPAQKATLESLSANQGSNWGVSAFGVGPANTNVNELAGSGSVTLTRLSGSTADWQASDNAAWLTLGATQGSGGSLGFSYSANKSTQPRVATITVSGGAGVTVTQAAGQLHGAIESPTNGSMLGRPFVVSGWAIDTAAATGIGVDVVHVWAAPTGGGSSVFLGAVVPSTSRPGVAGTYGVQYQNSGYELNVGALRPATYQLQAYPFRTATQSFGAPHTSLLTIRHVPTDFDGDLKTDLTAFSPSIGGVWSILFSSTGGAWAPTWGGYAGDIPLVGDYDGDGKGDLVAYSPSIGGVWSIKFSSNGGVWAPTWGGLSGDIPLVGDYDGDGKSDLTVFSPSLGGVWSIKFSSTGNNWAPTWGGLTGDIPLVGDYDGDGKSDLAVYSPSLGGVWSIKFSSNGSSWAPTWGGLSGDIPLVGDYDGDGKSDLAVYSPSLGGVWSIKFSSTGTNWAPTWGGYTGDIPQAADYDGDGKSDLVVFHPSLGGVWSIKLSSTGASWGPTWGGYAGDIPVAGGRRWY